jgi:hypothetical protein
MADMGWVENTNSCYLLFLRGSGCDERSKVVFLESSLSGLVDRVGTLSLIKLLINYVTSRLLRNTIELSTKLLSKEITITYIELRFLLDLRTSRVLRSGPWDPSGP